MSYRVLIPQPIADTGRNYLLERGYELVDGSGEDEESIIRDIVDCHAVTSRTSPYTKRVIDAGKKLKIIANFGVGVDNIDVDYAAKKGIWVTNTPTANTISVAEHTLYLILACAKNARAMDIGLRSGNYNVKNEFTGRELDSSTLGIVGLGRIGQMVGKMAWAGFNMQVIGYDPYVDKADVLNDIEVVDTLEEVFTRGDFVSLHIPCTSETKNSIGMKHFKLMKKDAFFINVARGEVVRELELIAALKEGLFQGASLDVTAIEPINMDNELLQLPNVFLTPHHASLTREGKDRMSYQLAKRIHEVFSGKKPGDAVNSPLLPG